MDAESLDLFRRYGCAAEDERREKGVRFWLTSPGQNVDPKFWSCLRLWAHHEAPNLAFPYMPKLLKYFYHILVILVPTST